MRRECHVFEAMLILSLCIFQLESQRDSAVPRGARGLRGCPNCGSTQGDTSWFVDAPYSLYLPMTDRIRSQVQC